MKLKKLAMLLPLLALFAFSGCMTAQVELRMEYDKLVKAITAETTTQEEIDAKKAKFLATTSNDTAKDFLDYIWTTAQNAKAVARQTVPDAKISLTTFGFKGEYNNATSNYQADAHFLLIITGTDYTAPVNLMNMNPEVAAPVINFHWYSVSADSEKIPVYNLVFTYHGNPPSYSKSKNEWKISGIKDSGVDTLTLDELQEMMAK